MHLWEIVIKEITNLQLFLLSRKVIDPITNKLLYTINSPAATGHTNLILINNKLQEIELFEPLITLDNKASLIIPNLSEYIQLYLSETKLFDNYRFYSPIDWCPIGPQAMQGIYQSLNIFSKYSRAGFCGYWIVYWLASRLRNPKLPRELLLRLTNERGVRELDTTIKNFYDALNSGNRALVLIYVLEEGFLEDYLQKRDSLVKYSTIKPVRLIATDLD
jgi:hypothetical protein